jgi:hypothetical protein
MYIYKYMYIHIHNYMTTHACPRGGSGRDLSDDDNDDI